MPALLRAACAAHHAGEGRVGRIAGGEGGSSQRDIARPLKEPIVSAKLFRLNVAPPATVRALAFEMRLAARVGECRR